MPNPNYVGINEKRRPVPIHLYQNHKDRVLKSKGASNQSFRLAETLYRIHKIR